MKYGIIQLWSSCEGCMKQYQFFKLNNKQVQYLILYHIKQNAYITQRECGKLVQRAVSVINEHLTNYEQEGLIQKKYHTSKTIFYYLTKKGEEELSKLQLTYLNSVINMNQSTLDQFQDFQRYLKDYNVHTALLIGEEQDIVVLDYFLPMINSQIKIEKKLILKEKDQMNAFINEINKIVISTHFDAIITTPNIIQDEKWADIIKSLQQNMLLIPFE